MNYKCNVQCTWLLVEKKNLKLVWGDRTKFPNRFVLWFFVFFLRNAIIVYVLHFVNGCEAENIIGTVTSCPVPRNSEQVANGSK